MFDKRFEGWYYKQSNGDITVAFIVIENHAIVAWFKRG